MRQYKKTRKMRGGRLNASSWGWSFGNLGSGWNQFINASSVQPSQTQIVPFRGGKRKRYNKKGGNLGVALGQAVVPGVLIAMNQTTKKKRQRQR